MLKIHILFMGKIINFPDNQLSSGSKKLKVKFLNNLNISKQSHNWVSQKLPFPY